MLSIERHLFYVLHVLVFFRLRRTQFLLRNTATNYGSGLWLELELKLGFSWTCVNPVLYGWMNDHYRAAFLALVTRRRRRGRGGGFSAAAAGSVAGKSGAHRAASMPPLSVGDGERSCGGGGESRAARSRGEACGNSNVVEIPLTPLTTRSTSSQPLTR